MHCQDPHKRHQGTKSMRKATKDWLAAKISKAAWITTPLLHYKLPSIDQKFEYLSAETPREDKVLKVYHRHGQCDWSFLVVAFVEPACLPALPSFLSFPRKERFIPSLLLCAAHKFKEQKGRPSRTLIFCKGPQQAAEVHAAMAKTVGPPPGLCFARLEKGAYADVACPCFHRASRSLWCMKA